MNAASPVALPELLMQRLTAALPGREAQRRFEPDLGFGRHFGPPPHDARLAAVMVLLYPSAGEWHVPLTVRPLELTAHGGQISLPGGSIEPDETDESAALRELQEELDVSPNDVTTLGRLTPLYIFGTKFWVQPWLAVCDRRPAFRPHADEVAELLEVPLSQLRNPAGWNKHVRIVRGLESTVPHIRVGEHRVWGATAMILGELIALVGE